MYPKSWVKTVQFTWDKPELHLWEFLQELEQVSHKEFADHIKWHIKAATGKYYAIQIEYLEDEENTYVDVTLYADSPVAEQAELRFPHMRYERYKTWKPE
jgi:hypothetical protein